MRVGDKLTIAPALTPCQVKFIINSKEEMVKFANSGENIKIGLHGLESLEYLNKGDIICERDNPTPVAQVFLAHIEVLDLYESMLISKGS